MGYATIVNVPYIDSYEKALAKWQSTKPIRGRTPEIRPLGQRRDCDVYSIRKNVWTDVIELVLYKTPVVKFTPEDEVVINFGGWASSSTCQFVGGVLRNVYAGRQRGNVVLSFSNGAKAMLGTNEELVLVRGAHGGWVPRAKQTLYNYRINRKEANNVRKLASQFRDYLAGIVKLKAENLQGLYGRDGYNVVSTTYAELFEVFGKEEMSAHSGFRPDIVKWVQLSEKPRYYRPEDKAAKWAAYRERAAQFFELVRNDQDENTRHQNYWIAFNILFAQPDNFYWRTDINHKVHMNTEYFEKFLDKALLSMFSERVFEKIAMPEGKVPSGKYDNYVLNEES